MADQLRAIDLIKTHHLYVDGLEVFAGSPQMRSQIRTDWVAHLISKKDYKQALNLLVLDAGNGERVAECCRKIADWKTGLQYLRVWEKDRLTPFLTSMKQDLIKLKAYKEAAKVAEQLGESPVKVCGLYLKAQHYKKAKMSLIGADLPPADAAEVKTDLTVAVSIELNTLRQLAKDLTYWRSRLETVQKTKANPPEDDADGLPSSDTASFQSKDSVISGASDSSKVSKFTGMSLHFKSKNKRPKNLLGRKHKEGALYEEDWLVEALNEARLTDKQIKNLTHLAVFLINFGLPAEFAELRAELKRVVDALSKKGTRRSLEQAAFEKAHPEVFELYNHLKEFERVASPDDFKAEKEMIKKLDFE